MKEHINIKVISAVASLIPISVPYWEDFILNKYIVYESFLPAIDEILRGHKFWLTREYRSHKNEWSADERAIGLDRAYRLILQEDGALPEGIIAQIGALPIVERVRGLIIGSAQIPVGISSGILSLPGEDPGAMIYLPYARQWTKGSKKIRIAVLDTGVDINHPELKSCIVTHKDFVNLQGLDTSTFIGEVMGMDDSHEDKVGHGTHVTGIIAAKGLQMEEGVAPDCSILAVRVLAPMRSGNRIVGAGIVDNINNGIKWAVDNGADVINMSLGIKHTGGGLPHEDVVKYAIKKNVTIVAASGNDGTAEMYYPAALDGVVAVGAVDYTGQVTGFTSYGAPITTVAPGLHIYSSFPGGSYNYLSGTSQASPFVTGAIALMKSYALEQGKRLSNRQVEMLLRNSCDRLTDRVRDQRAGYGLINLADAFKLLNNNIS